MAKAKLSETEQKVLEILRQGVKSIDDIKSSMERQAGHAFHRRIIINVVSRLRKMRVGVRAKKHPRSRRAHYVATA